MNSNQNGIHSKHESKPVNDEWSQGEQENFSKAPREPDIFSVYSLHSKYASVLLIIFAGLIVLYSILVAVPYGMAQGITTREKAVFAVTQTSNFVLIPLVIILTSNRILLMLARRKSKKEAHIIDARDKQWHSWNNRREAATEAGEPFNEPPPR